MNLGELYIKISVDDGQLDSLVNSFNNAVSAAERAASQIESAFESAGKAAGSTDELSDSLQNAVAHGEILGNVLSSAFESVIDLAGQAADAVTGLIGDAVQSYSDFEQNYETFKSTFGESTDEFLQWMKDSTSTVGMSLNEMMEHANESGIILQRASAERREAEAQGEQLSTDEQKAQIDQRLSDFKAGLAAQETELKNHQSDVYDFYKNQYQDEYDALKDSLSRQLDEIKQHNDEVYNERKSALDQQLSLLKDELSDEYDTLKSELDAQVQLRRQAQAEALSAMKASFDAEYSSLKSSLDSQLSSLQSSLNAQVSAMQSANSRALSAKKSSVDAQYNAAKSAMDAEVSAYQKATDARIKEINKEYTERYKLIDEQKYNELKALQDQIDALDEADKIASRSAQDRADQEKIANLTYTAAHGKFKEDREKAARELAELEISIQERKDKDLRSDQRDSLRDQMDAIRKHYDDMKAELKEQQSSEVSQYKDSRSAELSALKESNSAKLAEMKAAGQLEVESMRQSQSAALAALRESNKQQIASAREANSQKLKALKASQQQQLDAQKKADAQEIADMQKANSEQLKEKKRSNDEKIREQQEANKSELSELKRSMDEQEKEEARSNQARLKEVKRANDERLRELKRAQAQELADLKEHNRKLKEEEAARAKAAKKEVGKGGSTAEITEEDRTKSFESLKKLFETAANVGARRNKDASYVMSIFESMNYGRFATFDNLGLGYANKTGIEQMVADMGARLGKELDPTDFNDVAEALEELASKYEMTDAAAYEASNTIAGSAKAAKADWDTFVLALSAPEELGLSAEDALGRFMEDVKVLIESATPVVAEVIANIVQIIVEQGPTIVETIKTAIMNKLPEEWKQKIEDFKRDFGAIIETVKLVAVAFAGFVTASGIMSVIELFGKLGIEVGKVVKFFGDFIFGTEGIVSSSEVAATHGLTPFGGAVEALSKAFEFLMTPMGLAIAAFAGMVANSEDLRNLLGDVASTVGNVLKGAFEAVSPVIDLVVGLWDRLNKALGVVGDAIAKVFKPAWDKLVEIFGPVFQETGEKVHTIFKDISDIVLGLADGIGKVLQPIIEGLAKVLAPIIETVATFVGGALATLYDIFINGVLLGGLESLFNWLKEIGDVLSPLFDVLGEFFGWWKEQIDIFAEAVDEGLGGVVEWFRKLPDEIAAFFDHPGEWIKEHGKAIIDGFFEGINSAWEGVADFFKNLPDNVMGWLEDQFVIHSPSVKMAEIGTNVMAGFKEGAEGSEWTNVTNFFGNVGNTITGAFSNAGTWLTDKGSSVINGLQNGVNSSWNTVSTFFGGRQNAVTGFFQNAGNWLTSSGGSIISGLNSGLNDNWHYIADFIGNIGTTFTNYFSNSISWLVNAGTSIIIGFYNGLVGAWNDYVKGFITDIAQWIVDHKGPEDYDRGLLVKNGKAIMEGLKDGLSDGFVSTVVPYVSSVADSIKDHAEVPNIDYSTAFNGVQNSLGTIRSDVVSLTRDIEMALSDSLERTKAYTKQLMDAVSGTFDNADNILYGAGLKIMNGFYRGLNERWHDIQKFVLEMAKWIQENKGPEAYDKKLLVKNGQWIMEGLANGLEDGFDKSVEQYVVQIASMVQELFSNISVNLSNAFEPMSQGMYGLVDVFEDVTSAMVQEWKNAIAEMGNETAVFMSTGSMSGMPTSVSPFASSMLNNTRVRSDSLATQRQPQNMTAILELDHVQFGRLVYQLTEEERQRVGISLAGGYV